MDIEKFQQKALKQTKQKKSKSAEFLMVKEDREVMEGIGNPAFNMSSPDLLAHQTSDKSVIRHDMPDHTLAAHQQKFRAAASAEPKGSYSMLHFDCGDKDKGNEYSRNYFDPLMDEEINPRQCGMEVSREVKVIFDQGQPAGQREEAGICFPLTVPEAVWCHYTACVTGLRSIIPLQMPSLLFEFKMSILGCSAKVIRQRRFLCKVSVDSFHRRHGTTAWLLNHKDVAI
ncbi:LOW QUALITY PROTEIN: orofacial cleft 1 candidate gene 1 protein-like [Canis lupus dingo]|uniref:LOW QUALITY PROTEIN: orofacial cleft 1 candidate gene 1 protein-like n=1 Tax=Canis lupus dingo TaxID=286419 RepID=UPI0020C4CB81|nr:LOW QUALITY PROTEIN: orofacial cleft 1 candidate gene 1 protein-like [Canis lupus dingo]